MRTIRQYWQNLSARLRKLSALPHARELERRLSTPKDENQAQLLELQGIQAELDSLRSQDEEQLAGLQQRILDIEAARDAARHQVETLNNSLTEASSRLGKSESRVTDIEAARDAVRQQVEALNNSLTETSSRLDSTESRIIDIEAAREAARHQVATLKITLTETSSRLERAESRITDIEAARDAASEQVERLENDLAVTSTRLDSTETRVSDLDTRLEKERKKHQAEMRKAQVLAHKQQRRLSWALVLAVFALIQAGVASVIWVWDVRNNAELLANVGRDIKDIKLSMEQYLVDSLHQTPGDKAKPLSAETGAGHASATAAVPVSKKVLDTVQPQPEKESMQPKRAMLEPDYVFDEYLYRGETSYRTRKEMRAFFEEVALQPGVSSLESGLQYKVLSSGSGRSPEATDTVVIDYRAFTPDGEEFDSSYNQAAPAKVIVNEAIPGIREALQHMEEGAQWELYIPPSLAYKGTRKRGRSGFMPLIYVVELKSIVEADASEEP